MYKESKIAAVLPVYNEEKFIGDVIRSIPDYIDRIVVVDKLDRLFKLVK
jgi:glycosyltransferase involved in cell wall biosynthesis